jgi:AcrR family transcriptional regulator
MVRRSGTRGEQTREHLLDVAERLFGDEGVANVSLRQIRIAAGQGNEGAVQYHFGDRAGMLLALAERHLPRVEAIQEEIQADIDARTGRRRPSMGQLVDLFVRPMAEYGSHGDAARAWIKIVAELTADPKVSLATIHAHAPKHGTAIGTELVARLSVQMAPEVAVARVWTVAQLSFHICADRARLTDDPRAARQLVDDDAFVQNLVDMVLGALTAPVSVPQRRVPRDGTPGVTP